MKSSSFFDQEKAVAEIEIPRAKFIQLHKRFLKGEKIAAKLEFKKDQINLIIVDDCENVINLNNLAPKKPNNILFRIPSEKEANPIFVDFVNYYCKSNLGEEINELDQQFNKLSKSDSDSDSIQESVSEQLFKNRDELKLSHIDFTEEDKKAAAHQVQQQQFESIDEDQIKRTIIQFSRKSNYQPFTIDELNEIMPKIDKKKITKILLQICSVSKKNTKNQYTLNSGLRY